MSRAGSYLGRALPDGKERFMGMLCGSLDPPLILRHGLVCVALDETALFHLLYARERAELDAI